MAQVTHKDIEALAQVLAAALLTHTRRMMAATIFATGNTVQSMTPESAVRLADAIISLTKEQ